jgi:hypothetical protein
MVSKYISASSGSAHTATILTGIVGQAAALEFNGFLQVFGRVPSIDAIMLDPDGADVPTKPDERYAIAAGLVGRMTEKSFPIISRYLARMPKDFEVFAVKAGLAKCKAIQQTTDFIKWFAKNQGVIIG